MKNLKYFLDAEKAYKDSHKNADKMYYDLALEELVYKECPDDFLAKGYFSIFQGALNGNKIHGNDNIYGLTDVECMMLSVFMADSSAYFRNDYYSRFGKIPEVVKEMQIILNSLTKKAPKHKGCVLYRFLNSYDNNQLSVDDIYIPDHSLTTTTEDWRQDNHIYIITPLPENQTNAYALCEIYNHGKEKQVNFLAGTKFKVTKKVITKQGRISIYLTEIL